MISAKYHISPLLIRRLREGDECAFRAVFISLHKCVYRFALTFSKNEELSKEITQEAFIQLWVNREKLSEDLPLYPYLFTHVRRLTIDVFRKESLMRRYNEEWLATSELSSNETENSIFLGELTQITDHIMSILPQQQRLVFQLSRINGLSYEEIATQLNISRETVKYHLVRALKTVRKHLARHDFLYLLLVTAANL